MNISQLEEVRSINEKLETLYGRHTVKNLPDFRLSYCADQYERRSGTFKVYSGDIFLREETGIREVKKYAYIDDDIWLVERLVPNTHQDVMDGDYVYECFYAFKKIGHVPPLRAVIFLMNSLLVVGGLQPKTEAEAINRDNERKAHETKKIREILDTELDYTELSMRMKHGAAVSINNTDMKENNESK
jgi:hypothetical protein